MQEFGLGQNELLCAYDNVISNERVWFGIFEVQN